MNVAIRSFVSGEKVDAGLVDVDRNPSDLDDVVAELHAADEALAIAAVEAAREAFPAWARTTPLERAEILNRAGAELMARHEELGDLLAREEGKTRAEARGEALRAGQMLVQAGSQAMWVTGGHSRSIRPGVDVTIRRVPLGVVSLITPFNFPLAIPALKLGPALALGNTVVFKPADQVAACAVELVDILVRAGVPAGVLNLVLGNPAATGPVLSGHESVAAVSFTGSVPTGRAVLMSAAAHGARVQLEMGGKNPLVVLADADLDLAVELAVQGAWGSTGQRCTSSSFLVVEQPVHDEFVERLAARRAALRVGDALDPQTQMGPMVDERQLARSRSYVELAATEGAEVLGGELLERDRRGCYQAPALVLGTKPGDTINREEVFGPVVTVLPVGSYDEALALANATPYPLSAAIATRDLASAQHFRENSAAGMVMVNLPTAGVDHNMPFGGAGASSYGPREQGNGAIEFFTETRTNYVSAPGR